MASSFASISRHGAAVRVGSLSSMYTLCADQKRFLCSSAEAPTSAREQKPQP